MALTRITKGVIKPNENYDTHNINSTGIVTAIGLDVNGNADVSGSLSVGGVLTYEDVTSIDSVGIITARAGVVSPNADIDDFISVGSNIHLGNAGVITATSFVGSGAALTGIDATAIKDSGGNVKVQAQASGAVYTGIHTFNSNLDVDGHTNLDNVSVAGVTTFSNQLTRFVASNGGNTHLQVLSTGTGEAGIFFDAANGDISGSDYIFIGQQNNLDFIIKANPNAGNIDFQRGTDTKVRIDTSGNLNVNYDLDVDGHTNLDNLSIAGVSTFAGTLNASTVSTTALIASGDIDVDGHTNLDNLSIAGVTTIAHTGANQLIIKDSDTSGDNAHMRISFQDSGGTEKFFVGNNNSNGWLYLGSPSGQNNNVAFRINGNDRFQVNGNGIEVVGGSLYLPDSILHVSDTNTKIRFPAADTISMETAGSERLRINSSGTTLINTTIATGAAKLQLLQSSGDALLVRNHDTNYEGIILSNASGQARLMATSGGSTARPALTFFAGDAERLRISSSGVSCFSKTNASTGVAEPGNFILNVHTGAELNDGIKIVSNHNSGNQNSDSGKLMFCGEGQSNGVYIYKDNEVSYGKGALVFHTHSTANDYSTQLAETARFTAAGRFGLGTGGPGQNTVDSLMHIQGNSDDGDEACQLTIEDEDTTSGSKIPSIQFKGNGANTCRIRGTDNSGVTFSTWNGSAQIQRSIIGNMEEGGAFLLNADDRGWATFRHNNNQGLRTHIRRHYSPGNAVQTQTILRIRRHWWGWGTYKITCKALYYNSSLESVYYVNGHGSGGNNYSTSLLTYGGDASSQNWSCTVTHTASNNSPGSSSTWYADIKVNIPNYYYVTIVIEAFSSQYSTDPNNLGSDSYCLM